MSESVDTKQCSADGCEKTIEDTLAGRVQAWRDGWFIAKYNSAAWCPDDLPDWARWSLEKAARPVNTNGQNH